MKLNFKKVAALVLAVLMCVSAMVPVIGATENACPGTGKTHTATNCTYDVVGEQKATCDVGGSVNGKCKTCGVTFPVSQSAALGHDWDATTAASCTDSATRTCKVCGKKDVVKAADGHKWSAWTVVDAGGCAINAKRERTCSVCKEVEVDYMTASHSWVLVSYAAPELCVETGVANYKCENGCGATKSDVVLAASAAHNWVEKTSKEATCTADGATTYECTVCGEKATKRIAKLSDSAVASHKRWSTPTTAVAATCTTVGAKSTVYCLDCKTEFIAVDGVADSKVTSTNKVEIAVIHNPVVKKQVGASCTQAGYKVQYCAICEVTETVAIEKQTHVYYDDMIAALFGDGMNATKWAPYKKIFEDLREYCDLIDGVDDGKGIIPADYPGLEAYAGYDIYRYFRGMGTYNASETSNAKFYGRMACNIVNPFVSNWNDTYKAPTCTTNGSVEWKCMCTVENIDESGVKSYVQCDQTKTAAPATLMAADTSGYWAKLFKKNEDGHNMATGKEFNAEASVAATCTTGGVLVYNCKNVIADYNWDFAVGNTGAANSVQPAGNTIGNEKATLMVKTEIACSNVNQVVVEKTGHVETELVPVMEEVQIGTETVANPDYVDATTTPDVPETIEVPVMGTQPKQVMTCKKDGLYNKVCKECGVVIEENVVVKSDVAAFHSFDNEYNTLNTIDGDPTAATCTKATTVRVTCTTCESLPFNVVVEALGHDYDEVTEEWLETAVPTVEGDCENAAKYVLMCNNGCGEFTYHIDDVNYGKGHVKVYEYKQDSVLAPTCTTAGHAYGWKCKVEGCEYENTLGYDKEAELPNTHTNPATGKPVTYKDVPDANVSGAKTEADALAVKAPVDANGNVTLSVAIPGTSYVWVYAYAGDCTTAKTTAGLKCVECGDGAATITPAVGHTFAPVVEYATCEKGGMIANVCQTCEYTVITMLVPALGDEIVWDYVDLDVVEALLADADEFMDAVYEDLNEMIDDLDLPVTADEILAELFFQIDWYLANGMTDMPEELSAEVMAIYYFAPEIGRFTLGSVLAPTCDLAGYFAYTCNDCGTEFVKNMEATGHYNAAGALTDSCLDRNSNRKCDECKATIAKTHNFGDGTTCKECGLAK